MSNLFKIAKEIGRWQSGIPEDRRGAFAAIFSNGNDGIIWDGTKEHAFQCVIAWTRIPLKPELTYNPRAFQEPDYGLWIGIYTYTPEPEVSPENPCNEVTLKEGQCCIRDHDADGNCDVHKPSNLVDDDPYRFIGAYGTDEHKAWVNLCPECGEQRHGVGRWSSLGSSRYDQSCTKGHSWHLCTAHHVKVPGFSDQCLPTDLCTCGITKLPEDEIEAMSLRANALHQPVRVIINGKSYTLPSRLVSYEAIAKIAHPGAWTCSPHTTYRDRWVGLSGTLSPGTKVGIHNGCVFSCVLGIA